MNQFKHHPDGRIWLNDRVFDLADFMAVAPDYSLPSDIIGRVYEPGVRHILIGKYARLAGPMPWPEGDEYLLMLPAVEAQERARLTARRDAEEAALSPKQRRDREYPPLDDRVNAILEFIKSEGAAGKVLPDAIQAVLDSMAAVDAKYPDNGAN